MPSLRSGAEVRCQKKALASAAPPACAQKTRSEIPAPLQSGGPRVHRFRRRGPRSRGVLLVPTKIETASETARNSRTRITSDPVYTGFKWLETLRTRD